MCSLLRNVDNLYSVSVDSTIFAFRIYIYIAHVVFSAYMYVPSNYFTRFRKTVLRRDVCRYRVNMYKMKFLMLHLLCARLSIIYVHVFEYQSI